CQLAAFAGQCAPGGGVPAYRAIDAGVAADEEQSAMVPAERILAVDVGAGTQDILLWESDRSYENCVQLVLPSQTQIVAGRIRRETAARRAIYLTGALMGGGASSEAVAEHLAAGLAVYASPVAAKTLHDNPRRVEALGVRIVAEQPPGAIPIVMGDLDPAALGQALSLFDVALPARFAVAVFDHGESLELSNRRFRFQHHTHLLTTERLRELVEALRAGTLDFEEVFAEDGHGAIVHPDYRPAPAFDFVAVTGPNRALARPLGWYEAVPHGDMMLAGPF